MSRPQRPKRPGAALDAATRSGANLPESKRPKFDVRNPYTLAPDAPDATDVFLEVDEGAIGRRKLKRNRVDIEGYDSDSSEGGFDETHRAWKKDAAKGNKGKGKAVDDDGDDDDMFGSGNYGDGDDDEEEEEDGAGRRKDAKKNVAFLDLEQIEGQDFTSTREFADIIDEDAGRGDSDPSGAEEAEAEIIDPEIGAGGLKKRAPKLDAFNMASEMDEGRFDAAGNFIRKAAEKDAVHDSWLEGVSRKDMRRAKEARERRDKEAGESRRLEDMLPTEEVVAELIRCLEKGETVLEALARLGGKRGKKDKKKASWRSKKEPQKQEEQDPAEKRRKETVERITGAADRLLTRGQMEIYDETREALMRQFRRESGQDWVDPPPPENTADDGEGGTPGQGKNWEYRWTDGRDDDSVYGPYASMEMKSWNEHGFFGEGVEFRWVEGVEGWTRAADFD